MKYIKNKSDFEWYDNVVKLLNKYDDLNFEVLNIYFNIGYGAEKAAELYKEWAETK